MDSEARPKRDPEQEETSSSEGSLLREASSRSAGRHTHKSKASAGDHDFDPDSGKTHRHRAGAGLDREKMCSACP